MEGFTGFPEGRQPMVPLPEAFFGELLPIVDHLPELKITLHCFWLLSQKQGEVRYATLSELLADPAALRGAASAVAMTPAIRPDEALREGLERAVARGTLLQVDVERADGAHETCYLFNTERGREAVARMARGEWMPAEAAGAARLAARRPNIFNLYEQNMGLIQPLIAEELQEAAREYPADWIEDAFRIAVENNARSWSYVRAILERWRREGRAERGRGRAAGGEYADLINQ